MTITGEMLLGNKSVKGAGEAFKAINPATGQDIEPSFFSGDNNQVNAACTLAGEAFDVYRNTDIEQRALFLECIADEILALGEELIERAMAETGLPQARIEGERGRTMGQLKLFANVVRTGNWLDARIDTAMPERTPLPRSDLRSCHIALGPVAVFGASNFPLAFSVAGGDTASALAAGCPVVVKAHPAHPGTCELVGQAIISAAQKCDMPDGVFSLLVEKGIEMGAALVANPVIKAVGFTGSRAGGVALMNIAAKRPEPIPVFAEMSSINPVFLLADALETKAADIATGFAGSLTLGAGQFCTNPGLVVGLAGEALNRFIDSASEQLTASPAQTMLTPGIHAAYEKGLDDLAAHAAVSETASGQDSDQPNRCQAKMFRTKAAVFLEIESLANESLANEIFGAASLVVECETPDEMIQVAEHLEGQLTATLQLTDNDIEFAKRLMPVLARKAGRVLCNGFPTGVEVCHAMVHGGPFPATSDSRTTSVGSAAILRFLRPVCFQDFPQALLPEALRDENSLKINRLLNGEFSS